MKNFWVRTASATVYAVLFLGSIYASQLLGNKLAGGLIFTAFLLFVTCGCTFEFFRIVGKQGAVPCKWLGYVYAVAALLSLSGLVLNQEIGGFRLFGIAMTLLPICFALAPSSSCGTIVSSLSVMPPTRWCRCCMWLCRWA